MHPEAVKSSVTNCSRHMTSCDVVNAQLTLLHSSASQRRALPWSPAIPRWRICNISSTLQPPPSSLSLQFFLLFHCIGETIFFQKVLLPENHISPEYWMLNTPTTVSSSSITKAPRTKVVHAKMQGLLELGETVWKKK